MLSAALALAVAAPAWAQDVKWVSLFTDRDGETSYDPASIKRTGDRATLTLRSVASNAAAGSMIMKVEIDCKAQTLGFVSGRVYDASGALIRDRNAEAGKVDHEPIYDDEDIGPIYRTACPKGAALPKYPAGPPIVVVPPK